MAKKKPQTKPTEVATKLVKPLVEVRDKDGQIIPHPLEMLIETSKKAPVLKAVGFCPIGSQWCNYVITIQGGKVLSIEVSEPNMRQIIEEMAKIDFVQKFMDQEF